MSPLRKLIAENAESAETFFNELTKFHIKNIRGPRYIICKPIG